MLENFLRKKLKHLSSETKKISKMIEEFREQDDPLILQIKIGWNIWQKTDGVKHLLRALPKIL